MCQRPFDIMTASPGSPKESTGDGAQGSQQSQPQRQRRRQISLSTSRSVPNLTNLDPSQTPLRATPGIMLDEPTPRTPRQAPFMSAPSPLPRADTEDAAAAASDSERDSDQEFGSHYVLNRSRSSSSSSGSSSDSSATPSMNQSFSEEGGTRTQSTATTASEMGVSSGLGTSSSSVGANYKLSRSQSLAHMSSSFAPPFYNRPPTPLPPSPSLTSLLRPSFSATTSRPTTPDESENDTPNDTEAAVANSARTATTVPRASPKVPTYEYYGFVLYLTSSASFLMYLLWSYLPSPFLHQLGIYYYPNRWWSLAIPAFLVALLVYIYVALACYNTEILTLPINSLRNVVDEAANVAVLDVKGRVVLKGKKRKEEKEDKRTPRERGKRGRRDRERDLQRNKRIAKKGSKMSLNEASQESSDGRDDGLRDWEWKKAWNIGTDAVMDVPLGGVCEILYGDG